MGTISLETVEKFKGVRVTDVSTKARNQTNPISMGINVTFNDQMCSIHCNGSQRGPQIFLDAFYVSGAVSGVILN